MSERTDDDTSVRVALRIRPQLAREKIDMCQVCTNVLPGEQQLTLGKDKAFSFDHIFDMNSTQDAIYNQCVRVLIDGCFEGYNATVFAYGQTGSGKTYSMGTGFDVNTSPEEMGIIPRAVDHLFKSIEERRNQAVQENLPPPDFKVNAEFMELYNEEILDLMDTTRDPESRGRKSHIKIHEDAGGGIYVVGVTTRPVVSLQDTMQSLKAGALCRATASTNMNVQSSRSHAIFTLHIKQQRVVRDNSLIEDEEEKKTDSSEALNEFETLYAKFHFVDLAGSERLKRTGATGDRAKEGISINCGLLALGNVISALGDKAKKGSHVPYRDSKLTRLLQDSLGGNSRTLMIACISPSDRDFVETLNTLKYANRARNIKNKVIANQDKASKQLAQLRSEIIQLQQELMDYKSGKRSVDGDGVEVVNDLFHENTMLQTENDKMRQRIRALHETIETLTARNTQLLSEKAMLSLGDNPTNDEVTSLIQGYVKELEEMRAKVAESQATCDVMKRHQRTPTRLGMSPMMSPVPVMGSFEGPLSPDNSLTTLIEEARKDVQKMKKKQKRTKSRALSQGSDRGNLSDDEKDRNEAETEPHDNEPEKSEDRREKSDETEDNEGEKSDGDEDNEGEGDDKEIEMNGLEDDGDDEVEDELDSSSESDTDDKDSDNIHEDLAELTCEISIKQRLIDELEKNQKRLNSVKQQYEEKVMQLHTKIKETELERDTVLANISQLESMSAEKAKKIKDQFEKKLTDLQTDLKKMQAAKRDHSKLLKNQSHYEKQFKTLQHELQEMKKTKVRLMKQVKEEADKNKVNEARRNKEVAQLRKETVKKESKIRTLERETQQKEVVLRRKQEEVEALRKRHVPLSSKAAGRIGRYDRPKNIPIVPVTSSPRRRRKAEFSPKLAKQKWDSIEKNVTITIVKKQTISHMEKDMDVWLKHREKLGKKLERYMKKRNTAVTEGKSVEEVKELSDMIETLKNQVDYAQDNISECQTNIVQMEESKEEGEDIDVSALLNTLSLEEARYIMDHFLQFALSKGLALSHKDAELRELYARLHQTELNNTLQQDLLKHMMQDHVEIEVDNLMTGALDEIDSSASSSSSSPADSMFESQVPPQPQPAPTQGLLSAAELALKKEKARRKTATPEDLLYAGSLPKDGATPLLPVPEGKEEKSVKELDRGEPSNGGSDNTLMPPPKGPVLTRAGNSRTNLPILTRGDPGPSPILRRKEFPRPSPEPSPIFRRKNTLDRSARSSSADTATSSDTTPPSSPPMSRSMRSSDENVFSRLTSNSQLASNTNRGSIVPAGGRFNLNKAAPLLCTHMAEGHTKAVLSVCATEHLLFTSSKDRSAKVWDLQTGKELLTLAGHPNNVVKVKYCEQLGLVFTVSQSYINVWDIRNKTNRCIKTLSSSGLTQNGPVNFATSRLIELPPGEHHINDIVVNEDGSSLYTATGNVVRIWDLKRFCAIGKLSGGHQSAIMALAVNRCTTTDVVVTGSKDHYIKVFEVIEDSAGVSTPKYNLEPPHYDGIQSLAVHGDTLFSGSRDTCIKKWNLSTQQLKQSVNSAHKDWVCALNYMPGNSVLLSGCRAGYLKLWQVDTCQQLAEIKAHSSPINAIATNSTTIFTASNDQTVAFWREKSSAELIDSPDSTSDGHQSASC